MPKSPYFLQECPTCGRTLQVRVELLGREVTCQHCRGLLTAWDDEGAPRCAAPQTLLDRADRLLEEVEQRLAQPLETADYGREAAL